MSVPNQMIIQEFNYEACDVNNIYAKINIEALRHAMQDLTTINSLRLWLYLSKNKTGFAHLELSSTECTNNWGLGKSQWKDAKEALVSKGYLVPLKTDKKTGWYRFVQNPETGKNNIKIPETGTEDILVQIEEELPETGNCIQNSGNRKIDEIPETGKNTSVQIPETGKNSTETGLTSPEIIGERLQYYIDNIIIDNIDEWTECREYSLGYAIQSLGCKVVAEDENWYYVITSNNTKIKFNKGQNIQYVNYSNMF